MPTSLQERILAAIRGARLSQAAVARHCGVSRQMVTYWLSGDPDKHIAPTDEQLDCIAEATGVSASWLKGVSPKGGPSRGHVRESQARYKQSKARLWDQALHEALLATDPALSQRFGKRLYLRQLDTRMWFDFVGQQIVADVCFIRETGPRAVTACRARLWQLVVLRQLEQDFGLTRRYALIGVPLPPSAQAQQDCAETLRVVQAEAGVLDLEVEAFTEPADAARFLAEAER